MNEGDICLENSSYSWCINSLLHFVPSRLLEISSIYVCMTLYVYVYV